MNKKVLPWIIVFVLFQCGFHLSGGTNPASRFALLAALTEDGTYRINAYKDVSIDWSQTPDGNYYSNKAPGPALLGLPLFWIIDRALTGQLGTRAERDAYRLRFKARYLKALSWCLQVFPFAFLMAWLALFLQSQSRSPTAILASVLAVGFGNTSSLLLNTYYGHGMAALWVLAAGLALVRQRPLWLGWCLGWALLSDYSVALLFPGFAYAVWRCRLRLLPILGGAGFPAVLWVHYHVSCFGSPFTLPNAFQNPLFQDTLGEQWQWGGIFTLPRPSVLFQLLVGGERGLLWTQPWILALLFLGKEGKFPLRWLCLSGLVGLLVMNAAFGSWAGGLTPGPRYLSAVFPLFGLWLGLTWDALDPTRQRLLGTGLAVSLFFCALVFATHISPPAHAALWPHYLEATLVHPSSTTLLRLFILCLGIGVALWFSRRDPKPTEL